MSVKTWVEDAVSTIYSLFAKTSADALMDAARIGDVEALRKEFADGIDVNILCEIGELQKYTALHVAATHGQLDCVKALLEEGSDIDLCDFPDNFTALMLATKNGHLRVVEELITRGADIHERNAFAETVLYIACSVGNLAIVRLLIQHGADVNAVRKWGWTPLFGAAQHGHTRVIEELLESKADVDAVDYDSRTTLHWACSRGRVRVVKVLVSYGANICLCDEAGNNALFCAVRSGWNMNAVESARVLLKEPLANSHDIVGIGGDVYKRESDLAMRVFQ